MNGVDGLIRESATAQSNQVYTCITDRLFTCDDIGRNVLTGTAAALEHDVSAYMQELVEETAGRNDGIVVDNHFAGKLGRVANNTTVANLAVMTDMHVLHQQIAVTNSRLALGGRTTADGYILADRVVVTNLASGLFTLKLQVLRLGGDGDTREDLVVVAETCSEVQRYTII